jgi:alpha-ketoglutarate-dependent taurine dioxygenase
MSGFKGTRGEVKANYHNGDCFIVNDKKELILRVYTNEFVSIQKTEKNANLIVDAFKVRQQINCELSELLDAMEDVLNPKYQFEECADSGHLIPYNRIIKFNQLIKKVKGNG